MRMNFDFMQMGETSYSYFDVMLSRAQFLLSLLGDVSEFCFDCLCQMMEPKENEEQWVIQKFSRFYMCIVCICLCKLVYHVNIYSYSCTI